GTPQDSTGCHFPSTPRYRCSRYHGSPAWTHSFHAATVCSASSGCSMSPQPNSEHCSWVRPTSLKNDSLAYVFRPCGSQIQMPYWMDSPIARCSRSLARSASSTRFLSVISPTTYENLVRFESPGPILVTTADSQTAPVSRGCQYSKCTGFPSRSASR